MRCDLDVLGGTPAFAGKRVPVKNLVDYLAAGDSSLGNGALLKQAATAFDVLLTADRNIEFQQNLTTLPIPAVLQALESIPPKTLVRIGA